VLTYHVHRGRERFHVAAFNADGWLGARGYTGEKAHRREPLGSMIARVTGLSITEAEDIASRFLDGSRQRAARAGGISTSMVAAGVVAVTIGWLVAPLKWTRAAWRIARHGKAT
jgi:hypothetical protein